MTRPQALRVLVGTLHAGERELDRCVGSLHGQEYRNWEHVVLRDLPNKQAHDELYRLFMDHARDFHVFLKLDADMVFLDGHGLGRLVSFFDINPALDHVQLVVRDWFSQSSIWGLNAFSSRVEWEAGDERLFVDPFPRYEGEYRAIKRRPAPIVVHSPDPSPEQAFVFGAHRAMKALQLGRSPTEYRYARALMHWRIMRGTWIHFREARDRRLGLAVLGADLVREGKLSASVLHEKAQLRPAFEAYEHLSTEELMRELLPRWKAGAWRAMAFHASSAWRYVRRTLQHVATSPNVNSRP